MMKIDRLIILLIAGLWCMKSVAVQAQIAIKDCQFESPVKHKIRLSGTFGELRPNHFHAGIDIKSSKGHAGDSIISAEKGYISRIKIQASGYGRSLYINHPNGYTTVYAHLSSFRADIEKFVRDQQYKKKVFELNLYPSRNQFILDKGDEIGIMGNTGGSQGPHLHFEIRKTASEIPCNPLIFNDFCMDSIPPLVKEIKLYGLDQNFHEIFSTRKWVSKKGKTILKDTLIIPAWRMGMSVRVHDQSNGSHNKNGIYSIEMNVDGIQNYKFTADKCGFYETRFINAHMDYKERITHQKYWHKCYILPADHLSMYERNGKTGVLELYEGKARKVEILINDAYGNQTTYQFWVKRKKDFKVPITKPYQFKLKYSEDNYLTISNLSFYVPKGSLYQDVYFNMKPLDSLNIRGKFLVGDKNTPLHKYGQLSIVLDSSSIHTDKLVITSYDPKRKKYNTYGGRVKENVFKAKIRELGEFKLQLDTIAPTIMIRYFPKIVHQNDKIKFKIADNFIPRGKSKDLRFEAKIDGRWALLQYDLKTNTIIHPLDGRTLVGEHKFELMVKDDRNNISKFVKKFTIQ